MKTSRPSEAHDTKSLDSLIQKIVEIWHDERDFLKELEELKNKATDPSITDYIDKKIQESIPWIERIEKSYAEYVTYFFDNIKYGSPAKKEIILCAAIWYRDLPTDDILKPYNIGQGTVICGWRHSCIVSNVKTLSGLSSVPKSDNKKDAAGETVQGFLTNKNRFVDRKEAALLAYLAGQTAERIEGLTSEDVW